MSEKFRMRSEVNEGKRKNGKLSDRVNACRQVKDSSVCSITSKIHISVPLRQRFICLFHHVQLLVLRFDGPVFSNENALPPVAERKRAKKRHLVESREPSKAEGRGGRRQRRRGRFRGRGRRAWTKRSRHAEPQRFRRRRRGRNWR